VVYPYFARNSKRLTSFSERFKANMIVGTSNRLIQFASFVEKQTEELGRHKFKDLL